MRTLPYLWTTGLVCGLAGLFLIGWYSHWLVSVGVLLVIIGNNIDSRFNEILRKVVDE